MRLLFLRAVSILIGGAILAAAMPAARAYEVTPAEKRLIPFVANLPTCGDPSVLSFISSRFAEKEDKFWGTELEIAEYSDIKPLAFRPWGLDTIPRRYCTASVTVSDGRRTRVDYSVREDLAFIGNGWSVEWCVLGLDRNLSYSPSCRMARP